MQSAGHFSQTPLRLLHSVPGKYVCVYVLCLTRVVHIRAFFLWIIVALLLSDVLQHHDVISSFPGLTRQGNLLCVFRGCGDFLKRALR